MCRTGRDDHPVSRRRAAITCGNAAVGVLCHCAGDTLSLLRQNNDIIFCYAALALNLTAVKTANIPLRDGDIIVLHITRTGSIAAIDLVNRTACDGDTVACLDRLAVNRARTTNNARMGRIRDSAAVDLVDDIHRRIRRKCRGSINGDAVRLHVTCRTLVLSSVCRGEVSSQMIDRQLVIVRCMSGPREATVQLRLRPHLADRRISIMYDLAAVIAIVVQQQFVRLRRAAVRMQGKLMRICRSEFPFRRIKLQLRSGGSTLDERHPPPHILRVRRQVCCSGRNIIQRDTISCRVESPCIHDGEHTVPIMDVRAKVKVVRSEVIHGLNLCILCVDDELVVLCRCTTFRTDQLCSVKMRIA